MPTNAFWIMAVLLFIGIAILTSIIIDSKRYPWNWYGEDWEKKNKDKKSLGKLKW